MRWGFCLNVYRNLFFSLSFKELLEGPCLPKQTETLVVRKIIDLKRGIYSLPGTTILRTSFYHSKCWMTYSVPRFGFCLFWSKKWSNIKSCSLKVSLLMLLSQRCLELALLSFNFSFYWTNQDYNDIFNELLVIRGKVTISKAHTR